MVCQIPVIPDNHPTVPEDRERHRAAKLARPFTRSTERTAESAIRADNGDEGGLDVEDVQLTRAIEPNLVDVPEQLPILAGQGSDPVDLLEIGVQPAVFGREADDLLGGGGNRGKEAERPGVGAEK